ncbi:MAG: hypothetical protein OXJ52_04400 [Oligoflexia bacterium]|nr:hypothetical protein [Oligoflexia bacterium]
MTKYFFTKVSIYHLNETFNRILVRNYLVSKEFTMRNLISKSGDSENFEHNHNKQVKFCRQNKQILFRAKYKDISKMLIEIVSIWAKEEYYDRFFVTSKGPFAIDRLSKEGFHIHRNNKYVDDSFVKALIQELRDNPHNNKIDFNNLDF